MITFASPAPCSPSIGTLPPMHGRSGCVWCHDLTVGRKLAGDEFTVIMVVRDVRSDVKIRMAQALYNGEGE